MLGILMFLIISENLNEKIDHKYSLTCNILGVFIAASREAGIILPNPGINFEMRGKGNWSLNFEINVIFPIPIPTEIEVGVREYLQEEKKFRGFYLYQGLSWGYVNLVSLPEEEKYRKIVKYLPNLILTSGYKYVSRSGFTVDPFFVLRLMYGGGFMGFDLGPIEILPALGLYLGHSW
jgi:hypothetical protein